MTEEASERTAGLVVLAIAVLLLPYSLQVMQEHDDAVREHERECDTEYRLLVLDMIAPPDPVLCDELESEKSHKARVFLGALLMFILSSVSGMAMVLPSGDAGSGRPPSGPGLP